MNTIDDFEPADQELGEPSKYNGSNRSLRLVEGLAPDKVWYE
ncbi:hypothetical protein [Phreatobacter stygius]|nr:hypothetical protein [Phreatobacter stygius]